MSAFNRLLGPDLLAAIEAIVDARVDARLAECLSREPEASPYKTVPEAAAYLRCSRQRVYDLLSQRLLTRVKDGRRTLVLRAEIEGYLVRKPKRK
jgi:excisionase family DNA binding protein